MSVRRLARIVVFGCLLLAGGGGAARAAGTGDMAVSFLYQQPGGGPPGNTSYSRWRVTNVGTDVVYVAAVTANFDVGTSGSSPLRGTISVTQPYSSCSQLVCTVNANIAPGQSFDVGVSYTADIGPGQSIQIPTTVRVYSEGDSNPANDSETVSVTNTALPSTPSPPSLPYPSTAVTVPSSAPISVAAGDLVAVNANLTTSSGWLFAPLMAPKLWITLPGLDNVCVGCQLTAADLVSAIPTSGACTEMLLCTFAPTGPSTTSSVTLTFRGKTPGTYQLVLQGDYSSSSPVNVPFTVLPRIADLGVEIAAQTERIVTGKKFSRLVTIDNHGPDSVNDATLIVGTPKGVVVHATTAGGTCIASPVRCTLKEIDSGQTTTVQLSIVAARVGHYTIPVGIASKTAGDNATADNALQVHLTTISPFKPKKRRR